MTDFSPLPVLNDLTDCEKKVVDAARCGAELRLSALALGQLAAGEDTAHEVRAELLRELLLGRRGPLDPQGIRLIGLRIIGRLRLDQITASAGISLRRCVVAESIALTGSHFPWVSLQSSRLRRLLADGLQVDGDLKLQRTRISGVGEAGAVRLRGACVGGYVDLDGAEVVNDSGPAVYADRLTVGGGLYLREFQASGAGETGALRLISAQLGSQIALTNAKITNQSGPGVYADRLHVGGTMYLRGLRVSGAGEAGAVRLLSAQAGAHVDLGAAEIVNDSGPALQADRLQAGGDVQLRGVRLLGSGKSGVVRLINAQVKGHIDLDFAEAANADGDLLVDIRDADVATVAMPVSSVCAVRQPGVLCAGGNHVDLDRFTFGGLDAPGWREWLHLIRFHTKAYRPGPYQQLAAVERAAGHDGNARRILIRQQQDLYQRAPEAIGNWWARRFHRLWGVLAGYGYLARRTAGALLMALLVAGGLGLWAGHVSDGKHHAVERTTSFANGVGVPCSTIELIGVGLDRGLPLSSTGVRGRCDFNADAHWGAAFTAAAWLVQATVWALATLALAGYTGLVRKTG
ncbi:hypothetical protein ACFVYA_03185 [Amycolatopsis sp. NPDC058278]|uniref:hypothetical protein n=1 Tax=Amycolatopsis sp. NPDC058278 TaxID=3346417 RepID=UPI0036D81C8B